MQILPTKIPGVLEIIPRKIEDGRGFFAEIYNARALESAGVKTHFVQDNQSLSCSKYTLRGLHYQLPPYAQAKLVRAQKGRLWDVVVDIRQGSPTFGQWLGFELSAQNMKQLYIPEGLAHGFLTLEPDTEICYKVSSLYAPSHDRGIVWSDKDLAIDWPLKGEEPILSEKDSKLPQLRESDLVFKF